MAGKFDAVRRQKIENGGYIWKTETPGVFKGAGTRFRVAEIIKHPA
jgi:hypothetical protein